MTFDDFKAWMLGYCDALKNCSVTSEQLDRIIKQLNKVSAPAVNMITKTETIYLPCPHPHLHVQPLQAPIIPYWQMSQVICNGTTLTQSKTAGSTTPYTGYMTANNLSD